MAVKPGPVLVLAAKWLLVPIALGVVGYFVGTNIGDSPEVQPKSAESTEIGSDEEVNYPEPDVDVTVSRGSDVTERRHTSTRRRSSRPRTQEKREEPKQEAPKEEEPPTEESTRERPTPITDPPSDDSGDGDGDGDGESSD